MKLVIDIPEGVYKCVMDGTYCGTLYDELKNGVPVEPEKCGDCISRIDILKKLNNLCNNTCEYSKIQRKSMCDSCNLDLVFDMINNAKAVEPEKCGDCISRKALLRKLQKVATESWKMKLECNAEIVWNQCIDFVKDEPSIEPERKTGKCGDCVSRKELLKKFTYSYKGEKIPEVDCDNFPTQISFKDVKKWIREAPSVEPERKTGKWVDGKCNRCGTHAPFWEMATTYYCSDYCPKCGCRMKGGVNCNAED